MTSQIKSCSHHVRVSYPLLKQVDELLYALVHAAGVGLQDQLWSLRLLVLWVDACETWWNANIDLRPVSDATTLFTLYKTQTEQL